MTTSQGLLLVMADIDPAIERDFNQWYEQEHLSERMAIPGFLRARRVTAIEGSPKSLALYDLETSEILNSAAYRHVVGAGKSAWTRRMEPQFRNFTRNVYVYLRPSAINGTRVFTAAGSSFQPSAVLRDRDARAPRRRADSAA
ncbi:MAG: hypothetical protein WCD29_03845, partial [Pseudolabrys sp.]